MICAQAAAIPKFTRDANTKRLRSLGETVGDGERPRGEMGMRALHGLDPKCWEATLNLNHPRFVDPLAQTK
jgi:hypothetical protein